MTVPLHAQELLVWTCSTTCATTFVFAFQGEQTCMVKVVQHYQPASGVPYHQLKRSEDGGTAYQVAFMKFPERAFNRIPKHSSVVIVETSRGYCRWDQA